MLKMFPKKTLLLLGLIAVTAFFLVIVKIANNSPRQNLLNSAERSYVEASPQPYPSSQNSTTGLLVVSSNPSGARVLIDPPTEEVTSLQTNLPVNLTPFKDSNIPSGHHAVSILKDGYVEQIKEFDILENQVTRINVDLQLVENRNDDWQTKLPIENVNYLVEYDPLKKDIRVTFSDRTKSLNSDQINQLKEEVLNKLQIRGINTGIISIDWITK